MLLKLANRWRSKSNTFKDIIFIFRIYRRCKAAIQIFDILIGLGVMAEILNPYMSTFFDFMGCFSTLVWPSWPPQTKIQNSGSTKFNDRPRFRSFRENRLTRFGEFLQETERINRRKIKYLRYYSAIARSRNDNTRKNDIVFSWLP